MRLGELARAVLNRARGRAVSGGGSAPAGADAGEPSSGTPGMPPAGAGVGRGTGTPVGLFPPLDVDRGSTLTYLVLRWLGEGKSLLEVWTKALNRNLQRPSPWPKEEVDDLVLKLAETAEKAYGFHVPYCEEERRRHPWWYLRKPGESG